MGSSKDCISARTFSKACSVSSSNMTLHVPDFPAVDIPFYMGMIVIYTINGVFSPIEGFSGHPKKQQKASSLSVPMLSMSLLPRMQHSCYCLVSTYNILLIINLDTVQKAPAHCPLPSLFIHLFLEDSNSETGPQP